MGSKILLGFLSAVVILCLSGVSIAQHGHGTSMPAVPPKGPSQEMRTGSQPLQALTVEGFKVTFEVMDMSAHMSMPGMKGSSMTDSDHSKTHAFMVTIQDTASKEIISDAKIRYTLIRPSGAKETGKLVWSGDHYERSFNAQEKGAYQVQLQIESSGMEREAKFTYKL
jgi:hypothetical protein